MNVVAFLGGALTALLACVGYRRARPPRATPTEPAPADGSTETHLAVATAVLAVADRLTSAELCRRLGVALAPLTGIEIIAPEPGDPFDPARHVWESTASGGPADTIAAVTAPGLADATGAVVRQARVTVHG